MSNLEAHDSVFSWTDALPADLTLGGPRVLGYKVALLNTDGRTAGDSVPAFTTTGVAPLAVGGLRAEGSREGIVLRWATAPVGSGEVILRREDLAPAPPNAGTHSKSGRNTVGLVDLIAPPSSADPENLLDTTALPDTPYRYNAMRRSTVQVGGRSIELRSAPSASVELTLRAIYPPLTPTGLTAAAFGSDAFAVDLVWQPVNETGLIAPLAGYRVYRESLDSAGQPTAGRSRLNASPLVGAGVRDSSADPRLRYRYLVTAVDSKGNESAPAAILVEPTQK